MYIDLLPNSAIQVIPELRKVAKHLTSYQRTPAWIAPRDQFKYSKFAKFLLKYVPFLMRLYRNAIFFQVSCIQRVKYNSVINTARSMNSTLRILDITVLSTLAN